MIVLCILCGIRIYLLAIDFLEKMYLPTIFSYSSFPQSQGRFIHSLLAKFMMGLSTFQISI